MNSYPMMHFIGRFGGWLAVLLALIPLVAGIWVAALGWSPWWIAAGVVTAGIVFGAARSYVELVRVMIDMLLPK